MAVPLLVLLAGFLGGALSVFIKIGVQDIPPLSFTFLRFAIAALILLPFARVAGIGLLQKEGLGLLLLASLGNVGNVILFAFGIRYVSASVGQVLFLLTPILVYLASMCFLGERPSGKRSLGVGLGTLGAIVTVWQSSGAHFSLATDNALGTILLVLAIVLYSAYIVLSKKVLLSFSSQEQTLVMAVLTAAIVVLLLPFETGSFLPKIDSITPRALAALLYVAVVGTGAFYFLVQAIIRRGSPLAASSILYVQVVFTFIWSAVFTGERLPLGAFLGATLAIAGAFLTSQSARQKFKQA